MALRSPALDDVGPRLSLAELESVVGCLQHPVLIADAAGNLLSMNPAALALHGFASVDEARRFFRDHADQLEVRDAEGRMVPPERWPLAEAARGDLAGEVELHGLRRDTGRRWVGIHSARSLESAGRKLILATIRDVTECRSIEEALRDTEDRLHLAIEAAGMGTWYAVPYGPLEGSQRLREIYGIGDDLAIRNFDDFMSRVHPEDREKHRAAVLRSLDPAGDGTFEDEFRWIRPDREVRWLSSWGKTRFAEVDGVRRAVLGAGAVMDITDRKHGEERLAAEKERLAVTLRSIGDAVIATDEAARITVLNAVAEELTGWTAAEAVGRPLDEVFRIVAEDTRQPVPNPVERLLRDGHAATLAHHTALVRRDGAERPIADSCAPIRDAAGRVRGAVLVFRDQTDARRAEDALLRSQGELLELVEKLPIGVFVERDGRILYANPTLAEYLGHAHPSELVGKDTRGLLPAHAAPGGLAFGAGEDRDPFAPREWRLTRADGEKVVLEMSATRAVEFSGAPAVLWTVQDLTSLKVMQGQLMQADRLASVGMLAAGVAHEINNPLAYLLSALEYLHRELAAPAPPDSTATWNEMRDALADAREGATRVRQVVRDLKTFSRGDEESGHEVELQPVLESSLNMALNEIKYRARLVKAYGATPPVLANEGRLGQVFLNLLVNAAHAIPEGHVEENEIRLTTRTDERGRAVVEVRDSGSGIPADLLERIFDPFFTTKPTSLGTGLGLSICRNIVNALGGEIAVESDRSAGTTFRVVLPPAARRARRAPEPRPLPVRQVRRGRVLVVDDEPAMCASIQRVLSSEHEVVALQDAREARDRIARGERFDVILCDVMMPIMTGMELHAEILALDAAQAERIVLLTGGAFTPGAREFLDRVPNPRVEKPFDAASLCALVRGLL